MDTSENARYIACIAIFAAGWFIIYLNLRLLIRSALKRKLTRTGKVLPPLLMTALLFCVVDTFYIEPKFVGISRHKIETPKLESGTGIRIVQLSDLHLEGFGQREERMIRLTRRANPDIIVLTGDYRNGDLHHIHVAFNKVCNELRSIAPVYAVEGNWDSYADKQILTRNGIHVLENWEIIKTRGGHKVALAKLWWIKGSQLEPCPDSAKDLYKIVLCHMPHGVHEASSHGVDIVLAGHTHGGQIRIPIFGALLPDRRLVGKYQAGLYRENNTLLYVNRGIGMEGGSSPRVRFCCKPEVAVLDIIGKEKR